jgi:hypothetical protein
MSMVVERNKGALFLHDLLSVRFYSNLLSLFKTLRPLQTVGSLERKWVLPWGTPLRSRSDYAGQVDTTNTSYKMDIVVEASSGDLTLYLPFTPISLPPAPPTSLKAFYE